MRYKFRVPHKRYRLNLPKIHLKLDTDQDGVPDWKDCHPFNPRKQHAYSDLAPGTEIGMAQISGGAELGAGHMAPLQSADLMYGMEVVLRGKDKGKIRKKKAKK